MRWILAISTIATAIAAGATPAAVTQLLDGYAAAGAPAPDAARGAALWAREFPSAEGVRSCTSCHPADLAKAGRHATTGEPIEPMTAAGRLTDPAKIEKWFGRNCRWTMGRECTPGEKADALVFLVGGGR